MATALAARRVNVPRSREYEAALAQNDKAIAAFKKVREAYHARKIGDTEFLKARKEYTRAMAAFDDAFAKEQRRSSSPKTANATRKKPRNPAKLERCVRAVKKKGGAKSPYAVCKAKIKNAPRGALKGHRAVSDFFGTQDIDIIFNASPARAMSTLVGKTGKGFGVEHIDADEFDRKAGSASIRGLDYVNMGDPYKHTLMHDGREFFTGTWGDFAEKYGRTDRENKGQAKGTQLTRELAWASATDAGNRSMRKAGRSAWSRVDYNAAAKEFKRLWGKKSNPGKGFSVVQGRAQAEVKPEGQAWIVYMRGDKPKEFKNVEAAAKYARLRVHEVAVPARKNLGTGPLAAEQIIAGKQSLTSKVLRKLTRSNPEDSAEKMYHIFHGKPATQVLQITQQVHVHEWLWTVGTLCSLVVTRKGKSMKLCGPDPEKAPFEDVVMVAMNEAGNQVFFVGGDQGIDVEGLMDEFGMTELDVREHMKLGEVKQLTYRTSKNFENGGTTDIDFYHDLGKEHAGGELPVLIYKPLDPSMELAGGRYLVAAKDKQLGASPGITG
jgi:hypothetical protein